MPSDRGLAAKQRKHLENRIRALNGKRGNMKKSPAIRRWFGAKSLKGEIGATLLFSVALAVFVALFDKTLGIREGTVLIFVVVGWCSILKRIDDLSSEVGKIRREEFFDESPQGIYRQADNDSF